MIEEWRDIPDAPGYEVSSRGRVRSNMRSLARPVKFYTERIGYQAFGVGRRGARRVMRVHRAVALAFIQNPEGKAQVNHIDGNKANNCIENLEWATQSENMRHAYDTGLYKNQIQGETVGTSKLTEEQVRDIRAAKGTLKELGKRFGVSGTCIFLVRSRKRWTHVK